MVKNDSSHDAVQKTVNPRVTTSNTYKMSSLAPPTPIGTANKAFKSVTLHAQNIYICIFMK